MTESDEILKIDEPTTSNDPSTFQNASQLQSSAGTSQALAQNFMQGFGAIAKQSGKQLNVQINLQNVQNQNVNNKQGDTIHAANVISGSHIKVDQPGLRVGETSNRDAKNAANNNDETEDFAKFFPDSIELEPSLFMNYKEKISKYGNVYKGWQVHGKFGKKAIAVKSLEFSEQNKREAKILVGIPPHPNVINIIKCGNYKMGPFEHIFIAMELHGPQNLTDFIKDSAKPMSAEFKLNQIKQLIKGIAHIHKNSVIHRDIKPDNILVSKDGEHLKIIDFGLGKQLRKGRSVTKQTSMRIGTDGWRAPETYNADVTIKQSDIFSVGLVINFIWTEGKHPFGEDEDAWNFYIKLNQGCDLSKLEGDLKDLVGWMLRFNPRERPSLEQIQKHKWLGGEAACPLPDLSTAPAPMGKKRKKNDEYNKMQSEIEEKVRREFEEQMRGMQTEQEKQKIPQKYEEELSRGTGAASAPMDKELEKQDEYKKIEREIEKKIRREFEEEKQKITEKYEEELKRKTDSEFTPSYPWIIEQQPYDGKISCYEIPESPPGYEGRPTSVITYSFPAGELMGVSYEAAEFTEYLPFASIGEYAYSYPVIALHMMLKKAFNAGLLFKIQVFSPGQGRIIWNTDISHITNTNEKVAPGHFDKVRDTLAAKKIKWTL